MRLRRLTLRNFKGVESFTIEPEGRDVSIYGDNATGKTTIADAFTWLLFGKDSRARADFQIKTLKPDGEARHNLEHAVAAVLDVDGRTLELERIYKEKWTKPRGSAVKEFSGHETEYLVDGVPVRKGDFDEKVRSIAAFVDEEAFRLLTDPLHFNERLHWEDRRRILIDVAGDVTDEDVIASEPKLRDLDEVLDGRSADDATAVLEARRRKINKELEELPVRIDEVTTAQPGLDVTREEAEANLSEWLRRAANLTERLATLTTSGATSATRERLAEAKAALAEHEAQRRQRRAAATNEYHEAFRAAEAKAYDAQIALDRLIEQKSSLTRTIAELAPKRDRLRADYKQRAALKFEPVEGDNICACCGQSLPRDQVEAAARAALESFNSKRAAALKIIQDEGKRIAAEIDRAEHRLADVELALEGATETARSAAKLRDKAKAKLTAAETASKDEEVDDEGEVLRERVEALTQELTSGSEALNAQREQLRAEIEVVERERREAEKTLARFDARAQIEKRVAELEAREKELATEHERVSRGLYLLDLYLRAKADLLTEKINARFERARFQLFREQVNEGLRATCVTTYGGVPFPDLNHGAQLNVGLDIIRTLSEHYGFTPPVFVDNAESITKLLDVPGQMIRLVVSEGDKRLRVEVAAE